MANPKYENRMLYELDIKQLMPDPNQPRRHFDKDPLEELTRSIKELGVLQPILFRLDKEGKHIIVAGERRFKASQMAGLLKVPAIYTEGNPIEIALVENVLREDLTAVEEAEAMQRMQVEHGYSHEQLARVLGKSRSNVTEIMSITKLPEEILDDCRNDMKCSKSKLIEIAKLKTPKKMAALYERVKTMNLSSTQLKNLKSRKEKKAVAAIEKDMLETYIKMIVKRLNEGTETLPVDKKAELKNELMELKDLIDQFVGKIAI